MDPRNPIDFGDDPGTRDLITRQSRSNSTPTSRFRRFGLRTLLAAMAFVAVACAFPANVYRQYRLEQDVARQVKRLGGHVETVYREPGPLARWYSKREWRVRVRKIKFCDRTLDPALARRIGRLECITVLNLEGTDLTDEGLAALGGLDSLMQLNVSRTNVTGAGFRRFNNTSLLSLKAAAAPISDKGLSQIARLTELYDLDVSGTNVSSEGWAPLGSLSRLSLLWVGESAFGDEAAAQLARLPRLRYLSLRESDVSDAGLKPLAKLVHLAYVDLVGTRATKAGAEELRRRFPAAQVRFTLPRPPLSDVSTIGNSLPRSLDEQPLTGR